MMRIAINRLSVSLFILMMCVCSCNKDIVLEPAKSIVVEGWIDAGGYPVVILTRSLPVLLGRDDGVALDDLSDYVVRWAKVTVSDGETEVILTGGSDKDYFPPYIYTTGMIKGVPGKTYNLKVETDDQIITATTTIPDNPPAIDSIVISSISNDTTLAGINVYIKDNPGTHDYYKSFYVTDLNNHHFISSALGVVDDALSDSTFVMQIIRDGNLQEMNIDNVYYRKGTDVALKIATMDSLSYNLWQGYEDRIRLGFSFVTSTTANIPTNINGGVGLWCGYNAKTCAFKVNPKTFFLK